MSVDCRPVAAFDRSRQLEPVVDRAAHERDERLRRRSGGPEELGRDFVQSYEVIRGDCCACVVQRACVVRQLEGPQAQCFGEPEAGAPRFLRLARDGGPGAVELLGAARARERLERMEPEPSLVRFE